MSGFDLEILNSFTSRPQSIDPNKGLSGKTQSNEAGGTGKSAVTFGDLLVDKINEANSAIKVADSEVQNLVAGRTKNIHGAMIALEKADVSFKMLMQVRNKMIDAYREIMRMQV